MSPRPESIQGYQRLDSRGNPTIKVDVVVEGHRVSALVPSGASTGAFEAYELRDNERAYRGKGVLQAVKNIKEIENSIRNIDIFDQKAVDDAMIKLDGTYNKQRLGANAILGVSLAVARAAAEVKGIELFQHIGELYGNKSLYALPVPMMNVLNGGAHSRNNLAFQEFMIVPVGANSFSQAMRMGTEVYHALGGILRKNPGIGDEGGYAPDVFNPREGVKNIYKALGFLQKAIVQSGYSVGEDIAIALDVAASELLHSPGFIYRVGADRLVATDMVDLYDELTSHYPIISIEDGLAETDEDGWGLLTKRLGEETQLVGDDLFVSNPKFFRMRGINRKVANAILIKPNQIGTLTETLNVMKLAKRHGYKTIISHRSGETEDSFIADLAVATSAGQIKTGAPARGERTAKYNRLLDIEEIHLPALGFKPQYKGPKAFRKSGAV